jgi:hypothetical protein
MFWIVNSYLEKKDHSSQAYSKYFRNKIAQCDKKYGFAEESFDIEGQKELFNDILNTACDWFEDSHEYWGEVHNAANTLKKEALVRGEIEDIMKKICGDKIAENKEETMDMTKKWCGDKIAENKKEIARIYRTGPGKKVKNLCNTIRRTKEIINKAEQE